MSGRKVTGLPLPDTPKEAPPEIHGLVDVIELTLADSNTIEAARLLGRTFDYLTRYFAAVAGGVAQRLELQSESDVPLEFEKVRELLKERLTTLGEKATDSQSKLIRSVFFVGATRKVPTPRRHARLLDLGGIPIRGYRNLVEWIAIEPGEGELATDSKANRELLRYLPILKEWLTATATFFLDAKDSRVVWLSANSINLELAIEGSSLTVGPITLPEDLVALLPQGEAGSTGAERVEEEPPRAHAVSPEPEADPPGSVEEDAKPEPEPVAQEPVPSPEAEKPSPEPPSEPEKTEPVAEEPSPEPPSEPEKTEPVAEEPSPEPPAEPEKTEPVAEEPSPEPPSEPEKTEPVAEEPSPEPPAEPEKTEPLAEEPSPEPVVEEPSPESSEPEKTEPEPESSELAAQESAEELEKPSRASGVLAAPPKPRRPLARPGSSTEDLSAVAVEEPVAEPEPEPELEAEPEPVVEVPAEPEPIGKPPAPVVPSPLSPLPAASAKDLKDPTVAALRAATKPEVDDTPPYPWVTGPPPEFFDEIPVEADYPPVLAAALNDLNGAIEANDSILICGQMQRCFDLMVQFFGGVAGAIVYEIDPDQLFDFELEDGRFDLDTKLDFLINALAALEEYWESNDAGNLIWDVFYDTLLPATDPNCAYLHTRLLGVEGLVPDPLIEFREFCEIVPGKGRLSERAACREAAHRYLPILDFWLENATPLFLECEIDFVEEDGGQALSWAASISGTTLDGTPSGLWLEIDSSRWNLPRPELAPIFVVGDAPEILLPVVDELNNALEGGDFEKAGLCSRLCMDFLIQYYAGCAAAVWREQGEMNQIAQELYNPDASLADKERLLMMCLAGVSTETDVGISLHKLFAKSTLQSRALSRGGQPEGMAPLNEWASARAEVSESELLIYLPTLRSWLGAANLWFSNGEQLFEEPTEDGTLEGVVAFGEEFLEMVDPEYVIQLAEEFLKIAVPEAAPIPEGEVVEPKEADREFTGKLPMLPLLVKGPPVLVGHLSRLLESSEDRRATNAWLGSAFEYLIQYYAGLCTTVLGGADAPLPSSVKGFFKPKASLREREMLLVEAITKLKSSAEGETQAQIRDVFIDDSGEWRPHTKFLGIYGAGSLGEGEMLLSYWCRQRHQVEGLSTEDYHFATAALRSWVEASKPFFEGVEHYAEDPGSDGLEEIVLELEEDYFDMVLPDYAIQVPARGYYEVLYRESDYAASQEVSEFFPEDVRPDLLGASVELGGIADESGEMLLGGAGTMELGGDDLFAGAAGGYDSSDLFAGAAQPDAVGDEMFTGAAEEPAAESPYKTKKQQEAEEEAKKPVEKEVTAEEVLEALAGRRRKKKRKSEKGSAVLALLKKERLEKARRRAEARKRKAASEPTRLGFTLQYKGLKNSKRLDGRAHFGVIEIKNNGGGELKGTVEPAHPCVWVQPARFEGNEARIVYQVDPSDMPTTGRLGIVINTQDDRAELRLDRLVPNTWWSERTLMEAIGLVAAPSLIYAMFAIVGIGKLMGPALQKVIQNALNIPDAESLPLPDHLKLFLLALVAILPGAIAAPYYCKVLYSKLDYSVQEEGFRGLPVVMMLPTLFLAGTFFGFGSWNFILHEKAQSLAPLMVNRACPLALMFVANAVGAAYFTAQTTSWWEENSETDLASKVSKGFLAFVILLVIVTLVLS